MEENQNLKSSPRDVFMYILSTVTLYLTIFTSLSIVFDLINAAFPDPQLNPYFDLGNSIRWPLAALIIVFPVYLWITSTLEKEVVNAPVRSEFRVRKWLVYLTLFLAALLLIGDLVTLLYYFLGGDLTMRFALKVLAVLLVGGDVFGHYVWTLRDPKGNLKVRALRWASIAGVILVAAFGLYGAGSPFRQRSVRLDAQRTNDLQDLQSQIINYWQAKQVLPASIADLKNDISGFAPSSDPATGQQYEYRATGALAFELCATFDLASSAESGYQPNVPVEYGSNWDHAQGRACFDRTIDPQLYPPFGKTLPVQNLPSPAPKNP